MVPRAPCLITLEATPVALASAFSVFYGVVATRPKDDAAERVPCYVIRVW